MYVGTVKFTDDNVVSMGENVKENLEDYILELLCYKNQKH